MKLYDHQQKIINDNSDKMGLFMGTGSGKTRVALMLACGRTLVIAPKTQIEDMNWDRELRDIGWQTDITNIIAISKETFRRDHAMLPRFDTVIVDEAHTCLGVTPNVRWVNKKPIPKASQLFEALQAFLDRTKPERFYPVTATIIKSPMTIWAAGHLLGKGWDWYKFRDRFYFRLPMPGREVFTPKNDDESKGKLAELVKKIGYTGQLSDYFDVPAQSYVVKYIELTKKQKERIKALPIEYPDPLVLLGKTHQVENGILSGDEFNQTEYFENGKVDKILDLATEFPKMIIFAKYRAQIHQIQKELISEGYKTFTLTGDTENRGGIIKEANDSDKYIFIAQAQISAGWELPDCPVMIFASMSYSVVDRIQAEGRILRANALKKNLYIDLIVKRGIDEAVYKSINNKKDFNERLYLHL